MNRCVVNRSSSPLAFEVNVTRPTIGYAARSMRGGTATRTVRVLLAQPATRNSPIRLPSNGRSFIAGPSAGALPFLVIGASQGAHEREQRGGDMITGPPSAGREDGGCVPARWSVGRAAASRYLVRHDVS